MTVAELIEQLQKEKPYLVVNVWDTKRERFTDRFYLQTAAFDSELLVTPSEGGARQLPPGQWASLFEDRTPPEQDRPPA